MCVRSAADARLEAANALLAACADRCADYRRQPSVVEMWKPAPDPLLDALVARLDATGKAA